MIPLSVDSSKPAAEAATTTVVYTPPPATVKSDAATSASDYSTRISRRSRVYVLLQNTHYVS